MPLIPGTDGVQKMSKSLGNYIGIDEPANEIYGKAMSLPDEQIVPYSELLTDIPDDDIGEMRSSLGDGSVNPMELKKRLARELVAQFHDGDAALEAERSFERTVQGGQRPDEIEEVWVNRRDFRQPNIPISVGEGELLVDLAHLLTLMGMASSNSEGRRLSDQRAIRVDGETNFKVDGLTAAIPEPYTRRPLAVVRDGSIIQRGSRLYKRLRLRD